VLKFSGIRVRGLVLLDLLAAEKRQH
jgi:hypothetical protein